MPLPPSAGGGWRGPLGRCTGAEGRAGVQGVARGRGALPTFQMPLPSAPLRLGPGMLGRPARPPASPGPPQRERPLRCGQPPAPGAVPPPRVLRGPPWWSRTGRESHPHVCSEHHKGSGQQKQTRRWEAPCPPCALQSPALRCSEVLRASWSPLSCRSPPWLALCWPAAPLPEDSRLLPQHVGVSCSLGGCGDASAATPPARRPSAKGPVEGACLHTRTPRELGPQAHWGRWRWWLLVVTGPTRGRKGVLAAAELGRAAFWVQISHQSSTQIPDLRGGLVARDMNFNITTMVLVTCPRDLSCLYVVLTAGLPESQPLALQPQARGSLTSPLEK